VSESIGKQLPPGWCETTIESLLWPLQDGRTLHQGWSPQCKKTPAPTDTDWGVLKTTAIQAGSFHSEHNKHLPKHLTPRPQIEVKAGDILITCAGPRVRCGVACLVRNTRPRLMMSGKMYRFRVSADHMEARFIEAFLLTPTATAAIDRMKTGGSDSGLNLTHSRFRLLSVPVAPLNEQRRIVDAIESYLTRLDDAVRSFERVQAKLKAYRASVLRAAVEGRLVQTEAALARAEKRTYEPAEMLLARILKERRLRWEEAELARFKAAGKTPKDGAWRAKYREPATPDTSTLPNLPEGWCWARAEQLSAFITKGTTPANGGMTAGSGEIPFVKVYNLTFDATLNFVKEPTFVSRDTHENFLARSICLSGDVLMNLVGPPLGKVSVLPSMFPEWNINQAIARYRLLPGIDRHLFAYVLLEERTLTWAKRRTKTTAGQVNLTLEAARDIPIPIPPLSEQSRIVDEIERQLSMAGATITAVVTGLGRCRRLRQAILQGAFEGKLVDQDSTDEPARVLIARIRTERGPLGAAKKKSRGRKVDGAA
jgi:type I restriction enzyme, S subunit